jgi:hypothetical protein
MPQIAQTTAASTTALPFTTRHPVNYPFSIIHYPFPTSILLLHAPRLRYYSEKKRSHDNGHY